MQLSCARGDLRPGLTECSRRDGRSSPGIPSGGVFLCLGVATTVVVSGPGHDGSLPRLRGRVHGNGSVP
ncbi:hypothetical protein NDU88_006445 [Pleurodeles waltl]|uniref:Uncharacterized protein n=1 Tax=Pleurodeles waltl TaxID=8319 RepID=A0AAV7QJ28_PLEWA|nr:hypothetical protein NDU88_006445 [Pleurodeles waltl]